MGTSVIAAIIVLGLLIFLHELGHFTVAKWSGGMVTRFSLGFGPRLFSWKRGETEYTISAVPLGGYVKMLGEDPEEEVPAYEAGRAFSHQPLLKRLAIVVAGPLFNLLLALFIFVGVYMVGVPSLTSEVGEIQAESKVQHGDADRGVGHERSART